MVLEQLVEWLLKEWKNLRGTSDLKLSDCSR